MTNWLLRLHGRLATVLLLSLLLGPSLFAPSLLRASAMAQMATLPGGLPQALADEWQRSGLPAASLSVAVVPLDGTATGFIFNADAPMNPASTMKLVTSYAALELLGPSYTYRTMAYSAAPLEGGVLRGDLVIKGSGDPHLTEEDLWLMLRQLRGRGVKEIAGNIGIDRSVYAAQQSDPAQFDGEPTRAYNVAPDAFLVNFNATTLTFFPDPAHQKVTTIAEPVLDEQRLGSPRLSSEACGDWKSRLGLDVSNPERIAFAGSYSTQCGDKSLNVSFEAPSRYSASLVTTLWHELGGKLDGRVVDAGVPASARVLAEHESEPLAVLLYDMNKFSNNVMARSVFLTLSAELMHVPASTDLSARVVRQALVQRNIDTTGMEFDNGSGLSRKERISARQMSLVLASAFRGSRMAELMATLPVAGTDGTMRNRVKSDAVAGHAHIKTGSLFDVRTQAGYVDASSGHRYIVVCFINDPAADRGRSFQDLLLNWVFDNG